MPRRGKEHRGTQRRLTFGFPLPRITVASLRNTFTPKGVILASLSEGEGARGMGIGALCFDFVDHPYARAPKEHRCVAEGEGGKKMQSIGVIDEIKAWRSTKSKRSQGERK